MKFQIGDKVKVIGDFGADPFKNDLYVGAVTTVLDYYEGDEYPIELKSFVEHVREDEIELTEEDVNVNEEE